MHKYHVILADGKERDVTAEAVELVDGALVFKDSYGEIVLTYAADSWVLCELERKDDRG